MRLRSAVEGGVEWDSDANLTAAATTTSITTTRRQKHADLRRRRQIRAPRGPRRADRIAHSYRVARRSPPPSSPPANLRRRARRVGTIQMLVDGATRGCARAIVDSIKHVQ